MPSYYDEEKKCRAGTMDVEQFYRESSESNRGFFRSLIADWEKCGGGLKWGAGGVGLRGKVGEKEVGVCFLAPAYSGKQDRIELSLTVLSKQIGAGQCELLKADLLSAAAERLKGKSMISIVEPGTLPATSQSLLVKVICNLL